MSTKKSKAERLASSGIDMRKPSLMLDLENAVLALEQAGYTEDMIFGFVNCILKGFIRNGMFAPEYIDMCRQIIEERSQPPAPRIITDINSIGRV